MKLVIGLGNPGQQYESTRHNLGFMVLDELATKRGLKFETVKEAQSAVASLELNGAEFKLAKPQTMMNLSGRSVRHLAEHLGIDAEQVIVVSDDFNLPFGQLRVRQGGEDGGHNGLGSIIAAIGERFWRFRIGVASGHVDKALHSEYVVSPFSPDERRQLNRVVEKAAELLEEYLAKGHLTHDTQRLV